MLSHKTVHQFIPTSKLSLDDHRKAVEKSQEELYMQEVWEDGALAE